MIPVIFPALSYLRCTNAMRIGQRSKHNTAISFKVNLASLDVKRSFGSCAKAPNWSQASMALARLSIGISLSLLRDTFGIFFRDSFELWVSKQQHSHVRVAMCLPTCWRPWPKFWMCSLKKHACQNQGSCALPALHSFVYCAGVWTYQSPIHLVVHNSKLLFTWKPSKKRIGGGGNELLAVQASEDPLYVAPSPSRRMLPLIDVPPMSIILIPPQQMLPPWMLPPPT